MLKIFLWTSSIAGVCILGIWSFSRWYHKPSLPKGFKQTVVAQGMDPSTMTMSPDGRIFILEKNGRVLIVEHDKLLPDPFLTIEVDNYNERGLAGMAFHPDFEENRFVYIYYTHIAGLHNRLSRFLAHNNQAIPHSEEIILDLDTLAGTVHNGGAMLFGTDGKLYIGTGDGGRPENAKNLTSLLGKILRLNDDGTVPEDNPYFDQLEGKYRSIWACGLRNPFNMCMDENSGKIYATDVGLDRWEEINEIEKGCFYGWPSLEGYRNEEDLPENYKDPLFAYPHSEGGCITGIALYQPEHIPFPKIFADKLFYSDYVHNYIKVLDVEEKKVLQTITDDVRQVVQILICSEGDVYYLQRNNLGTGSRIDNTSTRNGTLFKISYEEANRIKILEQPKSVFISDGEKASLGLIVKSKRTPYFQWFVDGIGIRAENQSNLELSPGLSDSGSIFLCLVYNTSDSIWSEPATLHVTSNKRPRPSLEIIYPDYNYRAGDTIKFKVMASDPEDGLLGNDHLTVWIDQILKERTFQVMSYQSGISSGAFPIPRIGETSTEVMYRIYLKATDNNRLSNTVWKDIHPEVSNFTVESTPQGLSILLNGLSKRAPFGFDAVIGILYQIEAPLIQIIEDTVYVFDSWEGDDIPRIYADELTPNKSHFIANYIKEIKPDGMGLTGHYYDNPTLEGEPVIVRIDPMLSDYYSYNESPVPGKIPTDNYSIRWEGFVMPYHVGDYLFHVISDDGVRIWIDGKLLLDKWFNQRPYPYSFAYCFDLKKPYPLKVEFFESVGSSWIQLAWSSTAFPKEIIPTSQLFPVDFVFREKGY